MKTNKLESKRSVQIIKRNLLIFINNFEDFFRIKNITYQKIILQYIKQFTIYKTIRSQKKQTEVC